MKKRNYKIFLAAIILSINTVVVSSPSVVHASSSINTSVEETSPKITLGGVSVKGGETVKVPINISNLKGRGVNKFNIKISFDQKIFKLNSCLMESKAISKTIGNIKTGQGYNYEECTIDIGYDFTKAENINGLYEEGDYIYIPLTAVNNVEDGVSYLKVETEPVIIDTNGNEYSGDSLAVENKPITFIYNKEVLKNSKIGENYLKFNEENIKDSNIDIKTYENKVTNIKCFVENWYNYNLVDGNDFVLSDNTLILKQSFLRNLVGRNAFVTINFDNGESQTIFINNGELNKYNKSKVSVQKIAPYNITIDSKVALLVTNISNTDMELGKLRINYYYEKADKYFDDSFKIDYASILGSNKDMRKFTMNMCSPLDCEEYYNTKSNLSISFEHKAGVLKPGETIVLRGHFNPYEGDTNRIESAEPCITYMDERI